MKKISFLLVLLMGVMFSLSAAISSPVQAQEQEDLDTILARAAAKSFLVTLTRPDLAEVTSFYVADNISEADVNKLGQITDYSIARSEWITPGQVYEVEAVLQPSNQSVVIQTGKPRARWQVVDIQAISTPASSSSSTTSTVSTSPTVDNGAGRLVFQTKNGAEIYVIKADGTGLTYVTHGIDPQLSPDGSKIAFTRWDPNYTLYTINIDGSDEKTWPSNQAQMKSPTWSSDGSKLIFSYLAYLNEGGFKHFFPGTLAIRSVRSVLRGGDVVNYPTIPSNARGIKANADGSIEYTIPPDAHWHLAQVDLTSSEYKPIPTGSNYNYAPVRDPNDNNKLFFRGDKGIASFNTLTQAGQSVSTDGWDRGPIAISPDGSKIAFSYWQSGHWEIHTLNADGSNRQRLTETPLSVIAAASRNQETMVTEEGYTTLNDAQPGSQENLNWNNAAPVWSPDGTKIAFMSDRNDKWEIWIMNADGSEQQQMFPNGELDQLDFEFAGVDDRMLSWQ